jgi:hypothetical protein
MLTIIPYPGTNTMNFKVCNNTASGITPGAITLNWTVGTFATIFSGTVTLATSAIGSGACAAAVTTTATGALTTDSVYTNFSSDPTGVTGYTPSTSGMLTIVSYAGSGNFSVKVCNNTGASITPGAITLNARIGR